MSIGYHGAGTIVGGDLINNPTLAPAFPTNWQPGHLGVMFGIMDISTGTNTIESSDPSGWTRLGAFGSNPGGATVAIAAWYRFLASGDSAPTFDIKGTGSFLSTDATSAIICCFTGVDPTTPLDGVTVISNSGSGSPATTSAVTSGTNEAWVVTLGGRGDNENFSSPTYGGSGTNVTLAINSGNSGGNDSQLMLAYKYLATTGSSGSFSVTTSSTDPYRLMTFCLRAATPNNNLRASLESLQAVNRSAVI